MTRHTERIHSAVNFDGETRHSTLASFEALVARIEAEAALENREVLWDTLELDIERSYADTRTLAQETHFAHTWTRLNGQVEAVKR